MDHHFDSKVVYSTEREHKSLYEWSLKELDAEGQQTGRDWIPWVWTLYFKAKDITLQESWGTRKTYPVDRDGETHEVTERKSIRAELTPHSHDRWPPSYSMLGTDRQVSKFLLVIEQIADNEDERCTIDGVVSFTTEVDFRDVTESDAIYIYLQFHAATFANYAQRITSGTVDSLMVQLGAVEGFYSDWSPSITTSDIKVLTADRKHAIENAPEGSKLPRLGKVGEARVYFASERQLPLLDTDTERAEDFEEAEGFAPDSAPVDQSALLEIARENRAQEMMQLIRNLRVAAWVVAVLLLALLFK